MPSDIYNINQLQGMRFADTVWCKVDVTTIKHCWCKAGILPDMNPFALAQPTMPISLLLNTDNIHIGQMDPIANAEQCVESTLNKLKLT
jgi:hypothetical protein